MSAEVARLEVHRHCPRCGASPVLLKPPHLIVCAACDLHLYHNACAATAAILLDPDDRVLLIRRGKDPGRGRLGMAGGFVDNDETAEGGLRREVREETGLEIGALEYLCSHPNHYPYRGIIYHTLDLFFVAHVPHFATAQPLDAVAELVIRPVTEIRAEDFAFTSMQAAWRVFIARRQSGEVTPPAEGSPAAGD